MQSIASYKLDLRKIVMRGRQKRQESLLGHISLEQQVPGNHQVRDIRRVVDLSVEQMHDIFADLHSHNRRLSTPQA